MKKAAVGTLFFLLHNATAMQRPARRYDPVKTLELKAVFDPKGLIIPCVFSVEKVRELILAGADPNVKVGGVENLYKEKSMMYFLLRGLYHYSKIGKGVSDRGMITFLFENNYKLDDDALKFAQELYQACLPSLMLHAKDITEKK